MMKRRDMVKGMSAAGLMGAVTGACTPPGNAALRNDDPAAPPHGFTMPDEAEPHARSFMQWPTDARIHGGAAGLSEVQHAIATIARAISRYEPLVMLAAAAHHPAITGALGQTTLGASTTLWDIPADDLWARDSGPTFLRNPAGELAIVDFNFNGWGGKQRHAADARIAGLVARRLGLPLIDSGVVGEQGGLEQDGAGTILAHASSWANANRNPGMNAAAIAARLEAAIGARHTIWAPGIAGRDITDYHIDALARFTAPGQVLIQLPDRPRRSDPWSIAAWETYEILKSARDANGRKLELVVIDEPVSIRSREDDFVASYVNYYICNGAVIAAQFGDDRADEAARSSLAALFPSRQIVMLDVDPIGAAGGGIHCATQQQPASRQTREPL